MLQALMEEGQTWCEFFLRLKVGRGGEIRGREWEDGVGRGWWPNQPNNLE